MGDLNTGPPEGKVCLTATPCASSLGPGWTQSAEYQDLGAHQVGGCAASLPCEIAVCQPQPQALSFKSREQSASCTAAYTVIVREPHCH